MIFGYYKNCLYTHRYKFSSDKEQINESQYIVSRPEPGSDPPFGSDRELGVTTMADLERIYAKDATSQVQFMNETRATLQIQSAQLERLEVQAGQMAKILLEEQQRSLRILEEPIREKENYAKELKDLVMKEDESTSPEPYEKTNDKVVKIIPEMTLWVPMHEEVNNERKKTPTYEVDEYIIHLNNELKGIIVKKKMKKYRKYKKNNDLGRLCAQVTD